MTAPSPARATVCWDEVEEGTDLPPVEFEASYEKVILNVASTWDFFPGHHDPVYARSQGQPNIYMSTLFFQGFVDRVVTDWTGPAAFIRRRQMRMVGSVCAGVQVTTQARVDRRYLADDDESLIDVSVTVFADDQPACSAIVTVRLPRSSASDSVE